MTTTGSGCDCHSGLSLIFLLFLLINNDTCHSLISNLQQHVHALCCALVDMMLGVDNNIVPCSIIENRRTVGNG